ncbi:MAG: MlaD family protein [Rubrivivax sp.]|nr:MlaD family protein [Rubrivivax sp.]
MKKSHTNDWMVGAAILATMVLIVASTLFLQQADLGDKRQGISARFRDVGNLQVGNVVVIRGVRSGKVREIALADAGWVVVEMDLDAGIILPTDPVVLIQSSSLLGRVPGARGRAQWRAADPRGGGAARRCRGRATERLPGCRAPRHRTAHHGGGRHRGERGLGGRTGAHGLRRHAPRASCARASGTSRH